MDVRIFTEPQQGAGYHRLATLAITAERLGFSGFFVSDHYLAMNDTPRLGPTDALTTLAGLARDTSTIRLGTLVCSSTFRWPGPLAVAATEIDHMSNGRLELGLGSGWFEAEHIAHGIPFPEVGVRFDRLEEQLEILRRFWSTPEGERFDFVGTHFTLRNCPALPKPAQPNGVPLIIGGRGARRTPSFAARFGAEYNLGFSQPSAFAVQRERVSRACETIGRDPGDLTYSIAQVVCVGADAAEVDRRAAAIGRTPEELRRNGIAGTPAEALERLAAFAHEGVERVYLQVLDDDDLDHVELLATDVMPIAETMPSGT